MAKETMVLSILVFYTFLIFIIGLVPNAEAEVSVNLDVDNIKEPGLISFLSDVKFFFATLFFNIKTLGIFNIIFAPLIGVMLWLLITVLLPGGGS